MELSTHIMGMGMGMGMGMYHGQGTNDHHHHHNNNKLQNMMGGDHEDDVYEDISESSLSSSIEDSSNSKELSSSDMDDDASSLSSSSSSSSSSSPRASNGPLFELSELMDELPIKRGLSKYYKGKSQSFTRLAKVTSLEDLAKKESPYQRRLKACRSYGACLNNFRSFNNCSPKPRISKKVSKASLSCLSRKGNFITTCRPPINPLQTSF